MSIPDRTATVGIIEARILQMTCGGTSIIYVRRQPEDRLAEIINLAEQHYVSGIADFLVVDLSGDPGALSVLGSRGDPLRYLASAMTADVVQLLRSDSGFAHATRIIIVDDAPPDELRALTVDSRVEFVPRFEFSPSAAGAM